MMENAHASYRRTRSVEIRKYTSERGDRSYKGWKNPLGGVKF